MTDAINAIGAAELAVGQFVYRRIETLMDAKAGTPEAAELDYLSDIASDVEEYGATGAEVEQRAPFQDDHGEEAMPSRSEPGCIKRLRAAEVLLSRLEWSGSFAGMMACPLCFQKMDDGHALDCAFQSLAGPSGKGRGKP